MSVRVGVESQSAKVGPQLGKIIAYLDFHRFSSVALTDTSRGKSDDNFLKTKWSRGGRSAPQPTN